MTMTATNETQDNSAQLILLEEPELEFRYGQKMRDPHMGLSLFGPFDADSSSQPRQLIHGVVGTNVGVRLFEEWTKLLNQPISVETLSTSDESGHNENKTFRLWPPFPGFGMAYSSVFSSTPAWTEKIGRDEIIQKASHKDANRRAFDVASLYYEAIRRAKLRDENLGVIICVIPEEVWINCRPQSKVKEGHGRVINRQERAFRRLQPDMFGEYTSDQYDLSVDFRRQLKARTMEFGIPIQLIRESTLRIGYPTEANGRGLTPESDRAWNLSTALYYKAGGKPWKLATARNGVCYIGLAFRRVDDAQKPNTACCAAQMFLDSGDGIVFKGEFGPWYSPDRKQCHLDRASAKQLLEGVLKTYREMGGQELKEIFLHSRSTIDPEEYAGYSDACPPGAKLVGIRVCMEKDGLKAYRPGKWPIVRGTLWRLNAQTAFLWTSGFKPDLLTYDGWEVPNPIRIDVQHGEADITQVASDIFGLTKLNYNACKLGEALPVTVGFSDAVGEILIANPGIQAAHPQFKFYI